MPTTTPNFYGAQVPGVTFQTWGPQGWSGDSGYHPYAGMNKDYFVVEPELERFLRAAGYTGPLTGGSGTPQQVDRREAADRGQTLLQAQQAEASNAWTRSPELDQFLADKGWSIQGGRYQQPGESQAINLQRLVDSSGNALAVNEYNDRTSTAEKLTRAGVGALMLYTGAGMAGLLGTPAAGAGAGTGTATLGATGTTVPTLASSQIGQIAPVIGGMSPVAVTAPAIGGGLLGAGAGVPSLGSSQIGQIAPTLAEPIAGIGGGTATLPAAGATVPSLGSSPIPQVGQTPTPNLPSLPSVGGGGLLSTINDLAKVGLPIAGAIEGSKPTPGAEQSNIRKLDPRLDELVFGQGGLLGDAKNWYQANKSGMNDTMRLATEQQRALLTHPEVMQGLLGMGRQGLGMMNTPIASNPFAQPGNAWAPLRNGG